MVARKGLGSGRTWRLREGRGKRDSASDGRDDRRAERHGAGEFEHGGDLGR